MEFGDGAEIDGEGEDHLLALAQAQVRRLDEHAGGAQVHGLAELASAAGNRDVHDRASPVSGVQSAFHCWSSYRIIFLSSSYRAPATHYAGAPGCRRCQ